MRPESSGIDIRDTGCRCSTRVANSYPADGVSGRPAEERYWRLSAPHGASRRAERRQLC